MKEYDVVQDLYRARRTVKGLLNLFRTEGTTDKPRPIRKVRELYRYHKGSQWMFDFLMRTLLNLGNWIFSVGLGLQHGFRGFQVSRHRFQEAARLRPPIHITEAQARKDLERLLAENKVKWED
jgi:hypothetical protein